MNLMTDTELRNILSKNIKNARIKAGYTQEQLAELSNISLSFLKDIEACKSGVSLLTLLNICNALKITTDELLKDCFHFSFIDGNNLAQQINMLSDYDKNAIYSLVTYYNNSQH